MACLLKITNFAVNISWVTENWWEHVFLAQQIFTPFKAILRSSRRSAQSTYSFVAVSLKFCHASRHVHWNWNQIRIVQILFEFFWLKPSSNYKQNDFHFLFLLTNWNTHFSIFLIRYIGKKDLWKHKNLSK